MSFELGFLIISSSRKLWSDFIIIILLSLCIYVGVPLVFLISDVNREMILILMTLRMKIWFFSVLEAFGLLHCLCLWLLCFPF